MATRLQKRTAELMLKKLQSKLDNLYNQQEASKSPTTGDQMKCGGKLKKSMPLGGGLSGFGEMTGDYINDVNQMYTSANNSPQMMNFAQDTYLASNPIDTIGGHSSPVMVGSAENKGWGTELGFNNNTALSALQLAPMLYNLGQGIFNKADQLNPSDYYNPYESEIRSTMRNRRFNIDPILESNRSAQRIGDYNARNIGLGAGAVNASRLGNLAARMRSDAEAYSNQSNINNEYLGQQAQMDAGLGAQRAATRLNVRDINDRNRAAKRSFLSQGFSNLSSYAQKQQLMKNMQAREPMYRDILMTYNPYADRYNPTFFNQ